MKRTRRMFVITGAVTLSLSALGVRLASTSAALAGSATTGQNVDWPVYGGEKSGGHYSALTQINRSNVDQLRVAWTYDTGETGGLETTPLIADGKMFVVAPSQKIAALEPATGKVLWRFAPGLTTGQPSRGLTYWSDGKQRILFANNLYNIWALNADTGAPIASFGSGGKIDLREGLGEEAMHAEMALTTPGQIFEDMLIVGFRTAEQKPAVRGDIRAFDIHTGALRWSFHTIPRPGELGYETWPAEAIQYTGAANNWAGMVIDEKRGIVYAPTGSAASDFYGADRVGNDLYADTLLALDARTGKRLWHFQGVHHDIWDRDFPSPPVLATLRHDGRMVDAVVQPTKQGVLYVFDRVTGEPLFPIEERAAPPSDVPGEQASRTQPTAAMPEPYARQRLTAEMLTTRTPESHAWAVEQFKSFRSEGQFVPLSVNKQTVVFPGFDGGAEWGGAGLDPTRGILYLNANDVAWTGGLTPTSHGGGKGLAAYQNQCAACHGADRAGNAPAFPSLIEASKRLSAEQMETVIHQGRGRMPAFPGIEGDPLAVLLAYVRSGQDAATQAESRGDKQEMESGSGSHAEDAYRFTGYKKFLDPDGYPAIVPPWGTLNAIDLNTGKYLWKVPLGQYPELAAKGMPDTGCENYGGPVVTAGGLVLIGATIYDHKMHAFDAQTGKLLWESVMPMAGAATPATYMVKGKQYVVIATSNARDRKARQGAVYVAFALP